MLEKIKGYMEENLLTCLLMLSMILFICFIFYQYGFLYTFKTSDDVFASIVLFIIFPIIVFIFYFINLLMILVYKGILNRKNILLRLLIATISIFVLSIIQLIVLVFVWQEKYISNSFINLMIILLPYILMILIQTKSIKYLKNELKTTLLSLLITIIVYMLINIENGVLMISLYNMIYLLFNNRFEVLKEKKVLMLGCIIVGIIYYINKDEIRIGTVTVDGEETSGNIYSDIEEKTGICYVRINGRKKICGKVEKGKHEGKWIEWYENGEKESEGNYLKGKKEGKWIEWDTDGKKKVEGNYVNNRKEGKWICYHKNGRKSSEGIYKNGEEEGKWIYWYQNGKKKSEEIYKNGKAKGKWIEYYENGKKESEVTYKDDEEIERIEYDEEGNRIEE